MFQKILRWIKEAFAKMLGQSSIKQALNVDIAVSQDMATALSLWLAMYTNTAAWIDADIRPLGLPAAIAGEIARPVTIEMKAQITGSPRAVFLQQQMDNVLPRLREMTEYGCALGGLVMKPFVSNGSIAVDYVRADAFVPTAFDGNGNMTGVIFVDTRQVNDQYFTRLEYHKLEGTTYTIQNLAYKSTTRDQLGFNVPLTSLPDWAELRPVTVIEAVRKPLYGYFRYPLANNIDPNSSLGISCYARAVELIQDADEIYYTLTWEFESGRRAIYVDDTAFEKDPVTGKRILRDRRLYRSAGLIGGTVGEGKLFEAWSPDFRDASINSGLDAVLKRIEVQCGLAAGSISDPNETVKTATELKIGRQRSYSTIVDTQKALSRALDDLLAAMDVLITITPSLARSVPRGPYVTVYDFDDSVIVDKDMQFQQDIRLVTAGLMGKVEFRMRNFKEDEATAKAKIAEVQAEQPEPQFPAIGA